MEYHSILISLIDYFSGIFLAVNPKGTTFLAITLIILLLLTFTISGAEVALFSLNKKDVNLLKTKQQMSTVNEPTQRRIQTLLEYFITH